MFWTKTYSKVFSNLGKKRHDRSIAKGISPEELREEKQSEKTKKLVIIMEGKCSFALMLHWCPSGWAFFEQNIKLDRPSV